MNIERFHNELAMRLGYERIVNDKRISISVEETEDPWVTLTVQGYGDFRFKASDKGEGVDTVTFSKEPDDVTMIIDSVHQAYIIANKTLF